MPDMLRPTGRPESVTSATNPLLVWAARLDHRYEVEVQYPEVKHNSYTALLVLFDTQADAKVIHAEEVGVSYGARFGPVESDISEWSVLAAKIIDALEDVAE